VTEAWHPQLKKDYGEDHLMAAISSAPGEAAEILAHLEADLVAFTEGAPEQDDVTILVLTRD
jgi:serine phosphatase RsbU (regulator of sigma subunit)